MLKELTPEDEGWIAGANDLDNMNHYEEGTEEYDLYEKGYAEGLAFPK